MAIELLYIIPLIAFAIFILIVIILFNRQRAVHNDQLQGADVTGLLQQTDSSAFKTVASAEDRLRQVEAKTTRITRAITEQQSIIDRFQTENSIYKNEISALNSNLRDLQKEYDIALSENYSLRARVKKLKESEQPQEYSDSMTLPDNAIPLRAALNAHPGSLAAASHKSLYEDTRLLTLKLDHKNGTVNLSESSKQG